MLTDTALKNLKPKPNAYKVTDRDGMYVLVSPSGAIAFRLDYRLNGRRETLTPPASPLMLLEPAVSWAGAPGRSPPTFPERDIIRGWRSVATRIARSGQFQLYDPI